MNRNNADQTWENLLARSTPTFAPETEPPYGFVTSTLAELRAERRQQREFERIGVRALWAALAALGVSAVLTLSLGLREQAPDFDPGVRSLVQVDSLPYS